MEVLNSVVPKMVLLSNVVLDSKVPGKEVLKAVVLSNSVVDSTVPDRFVVLTCVVVSSAEDVCSEELVPTLVVDMIEASLDEKDVLKPEEGPRLKVEVGEILEDTGVLLSIVDEIKTVLPSFVDEGTIVVL